jgi:uncharacterized membrane protein
MKQKTQMSSLVNIITVILVVGAVAWGVVKIRSQWTQGNSDTALQVDDGESEPVAAGPEAKATDAVVEEKRTAAENVEEAEVEEETEADAPPQDQTDEPAQEQDKPPGETVERPERSEQRFDMRQMWADLNLTPEEQARLRQGFGLAMQKWQSMSEEERQVETARLQAMRARWEAMSDDEQRETMGRMRGRFEEWRQSGGIELPELSLD